MSSKLFSSRLIPVLLLLCFSFLTACTKETEEPDIMAEAEAVHISSNADEIPLGKLPEDATPIHYQLDLVIDPDQENFSAGTGFPKRNLVYCYPQKQNHQDRI